jgi:transglutaminase-like putative cysteine protease
MQTTTDLRTRLRYQIDAPCHLILRIAAMSDERQQVAQCHFEARQNSAIVRHRAEHDAHDATLYRLDAAPGVLDIDYEATVIGPSLADVGGLREQSVSELPADVLPWLLPSRFCQSDQLVSFAFERFGGVPAGIERASAVCNFIHTHVRYELGSSTAQTTALDTLKARKGVCRDFAHLGVALCRALNMPARMVAGYYLFDTPPQDFHAIFEVWLGRWVRFDATGQTDPAQVIAVAVGRDAGDIAFATLFGAARMTGLEIALVRRDAASGKTLERAANQPVLAID